MTDFGLAKRVAEESVASQEQLTVSGQILGTLSYLPPDQASGGAGELGLQADVYACAAFYCMFAGRPPFQAATPLNTLLHVLEQDPVPLRRLNTATARDLETIAIPAAISTFTQGGREGTIPPRWSDPAEPPAAPMALAGAPTRSGRPVYASKERSCDTALSWLPPSPQPF